MIHPRVSEITRSLIERSRASRERYLARCREAAARGGGRRDLPCANAAHAYAAAEPVFKLRLREARTPNLAIVTAYNDMLSAHQPYERYPALLRAAAAEVGATAQVAGGVPAMCDGITQGRAGMELSLFSRDVIAMSTAVALSHDTFDAALYLGVCDKIVPGLLIGALAFGHLPAVFVPAGPMPSGLSNGEKAKIRQRHARGEVDRETLLEAEMQAYHAPGTCTFYGTANSNQLLMEIMGLHLPGAAFEPPGSPLRTALTRSAAHRAVEIALGTPGALPVAEVIDARALINGVVGLLATGGSTNHTIHLVAIARAAGFELTWDDFAGLSAIVPTLARIYPNGSADVNAFHAAGGTAWLIGELLGAGLLHEDVRTVAGDGLSRYARRPTDGPTLTWAAPPESSLDTTVLRGVREPFDPEGGIRVLDGALGRAVIKVSAVKAEHRIVEAPAAVFDSQAAVAEAVRRGELSRDVVVVVRFQGPAANGMPELHKLTPLLANLLDDGHRVALVTDGRMSGASGAVPAAIHVTPEAARGGPLARLRDGDRIRLDAVAGTLELLVDPHEWAARPAAIACADAAHEGCGRELFGLARHAVTGADQGASFILG